jgi:hypothetical protein
MSLRSMRTRPDRAFWWVLVCLLIPSGVRAQDESTDDRWDELQFFAGSWLGKETGASGVGEGDRQYGFIMDGKYLFAMNTSIFHPQEANPEGETHEDWSLFSRDTVRDAIILREFHSEGFVNQYVLDRDQSGVDKIVFVSESIENLPEGWRSRLTLTILGEHDFSEVFELAAPGREYEVLLRNNWRRVISRPVGGDFNTQ